jgi:plastocyanin
MRSFQIILVMAITAALAAGAAWSAGDSAKDAKDVVAIGGDAVVTERSGKSAQKDASGVVVWLVPQDGLQAVKEVSQRPRYRLVQRNKKFNPALLVVPVGSVVDFPNEDPWFHNVFSLYRGKRFDLGLYQAGAQRSVRFDRIGPSYLFCNIHPEMTGVVLAVDSELFGVSDKSGHYTIPGVALGKYTMHVWYASAGAESLEAMQRQVNIQEGSQALPAVSVRATRQVVADHKNKYGQDYDPQTLKTDY